MSPIYAKAITSSGNSSNKVYEKHLCRELIKVPYVNEQIKIGKLLKNLDKDVSDDFKNII